MYGRNLLALLFVFVAVITGSTGFGASLPRMRPYTGIGVVVFSKSQIDLDNNLGVTLYEEPGLSRVGIIEKTNLPGNEWVFGLAEGSPPLVVSARKGNWLRVIYDDAGREAWIDPQNKGQFQSWERFFKVQTCRMLPGLQPQYYQLQQQPGGKLLGTLTPKQVFRILKIENAWGMVLVDQARIGWVRWRDDDGRLTIGTGTL